MKHNKKRNTAFIYEALTRELTSAIVKKNIDRKAKIVSILKEYYGPSSILSSELRLYLVLLETINLQLPIAERILQETKTAYKLLDENNIFKTQSELIGVINKDLGADTWNSFVPNFKSLASVNAIFNSKTSVKQRVLFEQAAVDRMSAEALSSREASLQPIDNLTYNSFIRKFNDKYGNLLQEQKDLLNQYIASFADEGFELRLYLNEELSRLKGILGEFEKNDFPPLIEEKVGGVETYLESFRRREFTDQDLQKILKTQQLVQELEAHDHN
jgi:hypothetical protein